MPDPVAVFRLSNEYDSSPLHRGGALPGELDSDHPGDRQGGLAGDLAGDRSGSARGAIQPRALKLTLDLSRAIRHWGLFFEAKYTFDDGWDSAGDSNWYQREGARLAREIASELGEEFAIDLVADPDTESAIRFRSDEEADRPQAAAAARALTAEG